MKKLLISCTYYYPNISGVSIYGELLAEAMTKRFKVTVLTSETDSKESVRNKVKISQSKVLGRIGKGVLMPWFFIDAYQAVKDNDVINCHLPQLESIVLAFWATILRKKLIVTHHCEFEFTLPWPNLLTAIISFPAHFVTYLMADKIVAYTKDYADHSFFLKIFKKKIIFILPPVVVGKEDKKEIKKILHDVQNDNGEKIIGYVGRIGWEKGIDVLIDAFEKIASTMNVKLVLVGPYKNVVGDSSIDVVMKKIANNKNIILLGPMAHEKLVNFYKVCSCLVLPSTNNLETFGIVQAEAMVCGCPVVASNLPGVRVPVQMTGMGAIAQVGDSQDLANKISTVLQKTFVNTAKEIFLFKTFETSYSSLFGQP